MYVVSWETGFRPSMLNSNRACEAAAVRLLRITILPMMNLD